MSNLVIVAIPAEDERVWEISTEKIPHLTLLFLGEVGKVQNVDKILDFLHHATSTSLHPFYLDVESRGVLGADQADVVYFKEGWELPKIKDFRAQLLKNDAIFKAHVSEDKFPEWIPHLTLGYPAKPAKKVDGNNRIYSIYFDRLALWMGDYEGPEFRLKEKVYDLPEVAMSIPKRTLEDVLTHYGVKGMRWGHRKDRSPTEVTVTTTKKGRVRTQGGARQPAHPDAVVAKVAAQKGKKSGIDALSNKELQTLANRLNLEKKVSDLAGDQMTSNGRQVLEALLAVT